MRALSKGYPPKPRVEAEEAMTASQRQLGIGSILQGPFSEKQTRPSLRRTFSADMSSKKWLAQNALKKVPSSKELTALPAEDGDHRSCYSSSDEESDHVEQRKKGTERPGHLDIWSTIQAQKAKDSDALALPSYVHPLVKKSSSSLSQKSLEICTESLGSETGSDGFSSDFEEERRKKVETEAAGRMIKRPTFHPTVRSFPPPLPFISRPDGPHIHMRSYRCDGRLVLEAVPVQSQNYFRAERQGGRLLLTLARPLPNQQVLLKEDNYNLAEEDEDEEEDAEEEEEDIEEGVGSQLEEQEDPVFRATVRRHLMMEVKLHRILVMNKLLDDIPSRNNPNPWAGEDKLGKGKTEVVRVVPGPPRLLSSPVQAFNSYDHGWKRSAVHTSPPPNKLMLSTTNTYNNAKKKPSLLLKTNEFITIRCKESMKSLLILEPYCVATT